MKDSDVYLLYPLIWLIPPIHEVGHVLICWFFGLKVVSIEMMRMTYLASDGHIVHYFHWFYQWVLPCIISFSALIYICRYIDDYIEKKKVVNNEEML